MFWALTEVFGWMWLARDQVDSAISGAITKNEAYKEAQQRKFRFLEIPNFNRKHIALSALSCIIP